jgi:N-acetylmuramoyl-L-alanine amidase
VPHIVTRSDWGAKAPLGVTSMGVPTEKVYIHHTAGSERGAAGMRTIQADHMRPVAQGGRGFRDIAYSFVIDGDDGVIYEGRGSGVKGGHVHGDENLNHGVCLMGNYENESLTTQARRSLVELLRHGRDSGWWKISTIVGHRQEPGHVGDTACPGQHLFDDLQAIRDAVNDPSLLGALIPTPIEEEDQMFLYSAPNEAVFFCDGAVSVGLNEQVDLDTFLGQKVKHFKLDADTFAKFRQRFPGA